MNILDKIVASCRERLEVKKKKVRESSLQRVFNAPRRFFKENGEVTLIGECKKGSPSRGIFLDHYEPASIALQYEKGGVDAISVLTEPDFFYGNEMHLRDVKEKVSLPVLRKDFIFDRYQVKETWAMGADAILLIAAILSETELNKLAFYANELGLSILLEVHNRMELETAITIQADGIGINARNLKDFSIDLESAKELCILVPKDRIAVAESGIKSPQDGVEMYKAGFRGFLIGEYFITTEEREKKVREFASALK